MVCADDDKRVTRREHAGGYSLVALMAALTIALILMSAALPAWRYLIKNDREEELLFRAGQIADAIQAYQGKNGNASPTSLEMLVKGRYLRKLYKDPMTKDGRWRLIHQGEAVPGATPGGRLGAGTKGGSGTVGEDAGEAPPSTQASSGLGAPAGTTYGPVIGVASTSREKSLRVFNGRSRYSEWLFVAGQPRVIGRQMSLPGLPTGGPGASPSSVPSAGTPTPTAPPREPEQ